MENEKKINVDEDKAVKRNKDLYTEEFGWISDMELVRTGKCEPEKCKSACCKAFIIKGNTPTDDYNSGFFKNKNKNGDFVIKKHCLHLEDNKNQCYKWGHKDFPEVCKQLPNPNDPVYKHVFELCTFRFELRPIEPKGMDNE